MDRHKLEQRLLPVVNHLHWERVEDYLNFEREDLIERLLRSNDIKYINKVQGQIEYLDRILNLPKTIK